MMNCDPVVMEAHLRRRQEEIERALAKAAHLTELPARRSRRAGVDILRQQIGRSLIATGERVAGEPAALLREAA